MLTSVDNVLAVKVVDSPKYLLDSRGSILFCKLALLADTIEQFATNCQLSDNVIFVLSVCKLCFSNPHINHDHDRGQA